MHDSWAPARRREGEFVWVFMLEAALSHRARVWFWCSLSVGGCVFARIHVFVCTCVWWEDWWKKLEARSSAQLATGISWPRHFHVSCLARSSPLLFLRLFFFLSACIAIYTSFTSSSPSCLSSTCYRSSGDTFSLFPRLFSLSLCSFSPFISFHIYSSPPPPSSSPSPSLPVCGWAPVIGC